MYEYNAILERVIDADTLDVVLDLGFKLSLRTNVRLAHVDAPELNTQAGQDAKRFLKTLLTIELETNNPTLKVKTSKPDKYGRCLAEVTVNDIDLSAALIKHGHAKPYEGGPRNETTPTTRTSHEGLQEEHLQRTVSDGTRNRS